MREWYQVSQRNRRQEKGIGTQLCECYTINLGDHWENNFIDYCVYLGFFLFFFLMLSLPFAFLRL